MLKNDPAITDLISSIRSDFGHLLGDFNERLNDPDEVDALLEMLSSGHVPVDVKNR